MHVIFLWHCNLIILQRIYKDINFYILIYNKMRINSLYRNKNCHFIDFKFKLVIYLIAIGFQFLANYHPTLEKKTCFAMYIFILRSISLTIKQCRREDIGCRDANVQLGFSTSASQYIVRCNVCLHHRSGTFRCFISTLLSAKRIYFFAKNRAPKYFS